MLRCAFCHDEDQALTRCPGCGTALHADCWIQASACPTLGCGQERSSPASPDADRGGWWQTLLTSPMDKVLVVAVLALLFGGAVQRHREARAPWLEVRNASGHVLHDVHLSAWRLGATYVAHEDALAPGEVVRIVAMDGEYELNLGGVSHRERPDSQDVVHDDPADWQTRVLTIGPDGLLRHEATTNRSSRW